MVRGRRLYQYDVLAYPDVLFMYIYVDHSTFPPPFPQHVSCIAQSHLSAITYTVSATVCISVFRKYREKCRYYIMGVTVEKSQTHRINEQTAGIT